MNKKGQLARDSKLGPLACKANALPLLKLAITKKIKFIYQKSFHNSLFYQVVQKAKRVDSFKGS